jgi:hypothetical protein
MGMIAYIVHVMTPPKINESYGKQDLTLPWKREDWQMM